MKLTALTILTLALSTAALAQQPAPAAPPAKEERKVYFLHPKVKGLDHLQHMANALNEVEAVRRVRVDPYSSALILQCTENDFAEVQRIVGEMEKGAAQHQEARGLNHVALDVRVLLASGAAAATTSGVLPPALTDRLGSLFGYKSFQVLGTQLVQVKLGEEAVSETTFRAPGGSREYPFELKFKVDGKHDGLGVQASIKAHGQASIKTVFEAKLDKPVIIGNSTLRTGEALIYVVTARGE